MPTEWTRELVCQCLIDAFTIRPGLPVHSRWNASPVVTLLEVEIALSWETRFPILLGELRDGWTFLRTWAQCQATGESIAARRRQFGWKRKRFDLGRDQTADAIARALNEERVNRAKLLSGEAAEERLEQSGRIKVTLHAPGFVRLARKAA